MESTSSLALSSADLAVTVGVTTTVPMEIIFAAGLRPLDLNNVFITSGRSLDLVEAAERAGFPKNSCCWNKGVYGTAKELKLQRIVAVVQGDCSNTHALIEMLQSDGVEVVPFSFPYHRDETLLSQQLMRFAASLGASLDEAEEWKRKLDPLRALAHRIDDLTWRDGKGSGEENHLWSISCSDFFGDAETYEKQVTQKLATIESRSPTRKRLRLALTGIPPICGGLFQMIEEHGAQIVFDEIPRQFSMPPPTRSLLEQYRMYTYPYDIFGRLEDIQREIARRQVQGVIHYVQSFCFRQVQDVLLRRALNVPLLTLECDRPGPLDSRTMTRVEAFLELLSARVA